MYKSPEELFWNDPKIVEEFSLLPPPPYWEKFFSNFENPASVKVLDVGCGAGRNTVLLLKMGFDVWACDLHESMVRRAREKSKKYLRNKTNKRIVMADMKRLPFKDSVFNVIIANGIYHNVDSLSELRAAVGETARVLKRGGYVCINMFYAKNSKVPFKKLNVDKFTFLTKEGLHMVLLPKSRILGLLRELKIRPESKVATYRSLVNTGWRSVFRGVFRKF